MFDHRPCVSVTVAAPRALWVCPLLLSVLALAGGCQPTGEAATLAERITSDDGRELSPSLAPDGSVAYHRVTEPGNADIYVVRDGAPPQNLTADSPADDVEPAFSPDGQLIAFRSARDGGGIFVMSASGGGLRKVVGEGFNPSWSPDGREIVYAMLTAAASPYGAATGTAGIKVVNAQGGEARLVYGLNGYQPRVSPDGQRIVFWHYGNPGAQRDIWTIRLDGTDTTRVTNDEAVDWSPIWSNDGEHLYFASDRDGSMKIWRVAIDQSSGVTSAEPELVSRDEGAQLRGHLSMDAEGNLAYMDATISRSLTKVSLDAAGSTPGTATRLHEPVHSPAEFALSPDGQWIAWRTGERREDLYVMRSDGSDLRQLTDDAYRDRAPRWSSDGRKIIFRSERPVDGVAAYRWFSINPDGTGLERLGAAGTALAPQWSPDGSKVAWEGAATGGGEQLVMINADSTELRTLSTTPGIFDAPVWSPDSRRVAYREVRDGTGKAYVLDVTRAGAAPEALPPMDFQPLEWSADGRALAGNRIFGDRPPVALVYDLATRQFEEIAEAGAAPQWLANGRQLLIVRDGNTIQLVERATKSVRDLASVRPPNTLVYAISRDNSALYYLESELQGDVFRTTVPPQ